MTSTTNGERDFFVSFNRADHAWATWIAWVLEEAGYSVFFQDWGFRGNFVEHMNRARALCLNCNRRVRTDAACVSAGAREFRPRHDPAHPPPLKKFWERYRRGR
jgi:TIR domain